MWGGIEATIHRLGDTFYEQMERNGHKHRLSDLDLLVETGIKRFRYPVLMEQLAPKTLYDIDFSWTDARLPYLRSKGVNIIAGLLHHGSGSRYTSLDDEDFADNVAKYAKAVAQKYEWIDAYTPVNEPLTTARFSGLYGVWYPHAHDNKLFVKMLLNECKATVLAMREIRKVNPEAKLIQTEDIGRTQALQPNLKYQAYFENARRFLTFDLLTGRMNPDHPLWYYLVCQVDDSELFWFADNPMPPDVLGVNYYVTSERALDSRIELYPENMHGGNDREPYVDVELVRIGEMLGYYDILKTVWNRYKIPVAITEAHVDSTQEDKCRWLDRAWRDCLKLQKEGVDVRALTTWAVFGSFDWNSLLRNFNNYYEDGIFDVSDGTPKKTLLFEMVRSLSTTGKFNHRCLKEQGWWEREDRLTYPVHHPQYEQL